MVSTKRVILAAGSRLLREMLHRVLEKADRLDVIQELSDSGDLRSMIKRFDPEWVILSQPFSQQTHHWISSCMMDHPSVRFVFLSPHQNSMKMKWHTSCEEYYSNLSLKEFIDILEKDLQRI